MTDPICCPHCAEVTARLDHLEVTLTKLLNRLSDAFEISSELMGHLPQRIGPRLDRLELEADGHSEHLGEVTLQISELFRLAHFLMEKDSRGRHRRR